MPEQPGRPSGADVLDPSLPRAADTATQGAPASRTVTGPARVGRSTKELARRLQPGDVAVVDHCDLDRAGAAQLLQAGVLAVVNVAPSLTGRYPARGAQRLLAAGVPVLDAVGPDVLEHLSDGDLVVVDGSVLRCGSEQWSGKGGRAIASGRRLVLDEVELAVHAARQDVSRQLSAFARNTLTHLDEERSTLLEPPEVPALRLQVAGRQALLVSRGDGHRDDLAGLRGWITRERPLLVGVDGGADALLADGWTPDLVVGDMDSVSDASLTCGAEVVVHAYLDGRAPGLARVAAAGVAGHILPATGTSEDAALSLLDELGCELVVTVGAQSTMEDFLDKGREGMASTFVTRLRLGDRLVDASGISRLGVAASPSPAVASPRHRTSPTLAMSWTSRLSWASQGARAPRRGVLVLTALLLAAVVAGALVGAVVSHRAASAAGPTRAGAQASAQMRGAAAPVGSPGTGLS